MFLVAAVLASGITCAATWIALARGRAIPRAFDFNLLAEGIAFALRAHIAVLLGFLMARTSIALLRYQAAFAEVGYWSIAAQIVDALLLLPAPSACCCFPALVRAGEGDRSSAFTSIMARLAGVMAVVCAITAALAHPAITFVFGTAYAPAGAASRRLLPVDDFGRLAIPLRLRHSMDAGDRLGRGVAVADRHLARRRRGAWGGRSRLGAVGLRRSRMPIVIDDGI